MRFPSRRNLDDQLRSLEVGMVRALEVARNPERSEDDRRSFRGLVDHYLDRWLLVHDLRIIIELDRMLKRSSRDGS